MGLHGHTKIQLFDGSTGKLQQEVEDDNVVTNAVNYILNPPDYLRMGMYGGTPVNTALSPQTSAYSSYFGGVMCFTDKIDETLIYPPSSNRCIAYAGNSSGDSTKSRRGTLNSNESGSITNGYRWVWDFATDEGCGTISCVCLTSLAAGNLGLPSDYGASYAKSGTDFDATATYYATAHTAMNYNTTSPPLTSSLNGFYVEQLENGNLRVLATNVSEYNKTKIYEVIISNPFKLNLMSPIAGTAISASLVYNKYDNCYNGCSYVYNNKIHVVYDDKSDNTLIHHDILNLDTYAVESSKTITCGFAMKASSYGVLYYWDGKYSVTRASDNQRCWVDESGNLLSALQVAQHRGCYIDEDSNTCFGFYSNTTNSKQLGQVKADRYYYNGTDSYFCSTEATSFQISNNTNYDYGYASNVLFAKVKGYSLPLVCYITLFSRENYYSQFKWGYMYDYLATINNLSTTVKKTSEQTMKITYDLTQS